MLDIAPAPISEAPQARARRINEVVEALELPQHRRLDTKELARLVRHVGQQRDLYEDLVVDDAESRWWLLLLATPTFDLRVLAWEHEQGSDWHDHGGSSGAFVLTSGRLLERSRAADGIGVVSHTLERGDLGAFGPSHVHDVRHVDGAPAVSIHAYSPPLIGQTNYELTDLGFVATGYELEPDRASRRRLAA